MLNVVVVGAGITGLSAAISLRRVGHAVRLLERHSLTKELGAAMTIPHNASRTLLAWGIDPTAERYEVCRGMRLFDGSSLRETELPIPTGDRARQKYGAPSFFVHRVDFHESLRKLALEENGSGPPATLRRDAQVVKYDADSTSVTLSNGEVVTGDLIIAADGVHSIAVESILGRPNTPVPVPSSMQGKRYQNSCYRFLIPTSDIRDDPATRWFVDDCNSHLRLFVGPTQVVTYPCRENTLHNFVCMFYDKTLSENDVDNRSIPVDLDHFHKQITWLHPKVQGVMRKAKKVGAWPLFYREPLPTWKKGRLILAGDAAHPMLPHYGQGGAQGIEDAVALGIALAWATPAQVEERLKMYETIRMSRASALQVLSCTGQEQVAMVCKEAAKYMGSVPRNPPEIPDFTFGIQNDVVTQSVQLLKQSIPNFELPTTYFQT